jgi:hypothetical protein
VSHTLNIEVGFFFSLLHKVVFERQRREQFGDAAKRLLRRLERVDTRAASALRRARPE